LAVDAPVRFMSFEPLLGPISNVVCDPVESIAFGDEPLQMIADLDWVIIGAQTGRGPKPPLSEVHKWAQEIIDAADSAGIKVFLKDNLQWPVERREWPDGRVKC